MHECNTISNESFETMGEYIYKNDNRVTLLFMEKKKVMEKIFDMETIFKNTKKNIEELIIVHTELTKKNYNIDLQKTYSRSSSSFIYSTLHRSINHSTLTPIRKQMTEIFIKIDDSQNYKKHVALEIEILEKQLNDINRRIYEYCILD